MQTYIFIKISKEFKQKKYLQNVNIIAKKSLGRKNSQQNMFVKQKKFFHILLNQRASITP
jgi:hypothetical protein